MDTPLRKDCRVRLGWLQRLRWLHVVAGHCAPGAMAIGASAEVGSLALAVWAHVRSTGRGVSTIRHAEALDPLCNSVFALTGESAHDAMRDAIRRRWGLERHA